MQYIRERLSLNLVSSQPAGPENDAQDNPPRPPARRIREGINSPTNSNFSEASEPKPVDTPPSTYVTPYQSPFQSPVSSEKWAEHNRSAVPAQQMVVQLDNPATPRAVYVIDRGQFGGYPHPGYVNHAYTTDNGTPTTSTNPAYSNQPQPPHVVREQYWSWSCKCHRQYTNREKILLLVIGFLLLVIGGLSAYVAIISDDGNPLQGGLLTPGGISQAIH